MVLLLVCIVCHKLFTFAHARHPTVWVVCVQVFFLPATKHLWWALGIRPIDKITFGSLLMAGNSVVLVPGGLSECMMMKTGQPILQCNQLVFQILTFEPCLKYVMLNMLSMTWLHREVLRAYLASAFCVSVHGIQNRSAWKAKTVIART